MNVSAFNRLGNCSKYTMMNKEAVYLEVQRQAGQYQVSLFYLNGFYIELWLNLKTGQVEKAEAFTSCRKLDQYIAGIDLSPIYALL